MTDPGDASIPAPRAGRRRCSSPSPGATRPPSARRSPSTGSTHRRVLLCLRGVHAVGLGEAGGLRIGLAPYTTADDVDRLTSVLAATLALEAPGSFPAIISLGK